MTARNEDGGAAAPLDRARFEESYAGTPPWDIGRPRAEFVAVADRIVSPVLDAGCGTGEIALFLAARGHEVTGIDFVVQAVRRAREKAKKRGLSAEFLVKDALTLQGWGRRFATAIDSGLFHVFSDGDRRRYVEGLSAALEPVGRVFLACFSDEEPGTQGPRRISRRELEEAFAEGWAIESIEGVQFEVNEGTAYSPGGPKGWFAVFRRKA
ncbi:MAG: methyltransferase domain-containing protein [Planctomycetes bacterium]|nr:methyltransferase domain-containing protein [Planctomycetota bacterium]